VAWGGAALFVLSLVYFAVAYLTRFGQVHEGRPSVGVVAWNLGLFSAFAVHHSIFAREAVRARVDRWLPAGLERSAYVWLASLLFLAVCIYWQPVAGVAWRVEGPAVWLARLLQAAGAWLTVRSAAILDIWDLSGVKQIQAGGAGKAGGQDRASASAHSPTSPTRPTGEFKTSGPYGWVRHPIYAGWFLIVFAASPMTNTRLVFAIASTVYLLVGMHLEERSMRATSNGAYERYAQVVRWKIVPGIY
jgi:protein-S-isoprenylcysteine O-methyltransferase Ste14